MSGVIVGAAVIGAGASIYGADKNSKAGSSAQKSQEKMSAADLAFRQQQYDRYMGLFGPVENQLAAEARSSEPLGYDRMKAQIETQAGEAGRNMSASMAQRGIAGSGLDVGGMRGLAMNKMNALSGAYSQGLENKRNLGLTLTGRGQIGAAAQGLSGGMQNMAALYGNQADLYNRAAQQGWQNAGQSLQGLASYYGQKQLAAKPAVAPAQETQTGMTPFQGWSYDDLNTQAPVAPMFGKNYNLY